MHTFRLVDLEELVPVHKVGRLTLNRNPDNYSIETEQVAFHTGHKLVQSQPVQLQQPSDAGTAGPPPFRTRRQMISRVEGSEAAVDQFHCKSRP